MSNEEFKEIYNQLTPENKYKVYLKYLELLREQEKEKNHART